METGRELVKATEVKLPKFVEDAYNTIDGMNQFAQMLLDSKLVPDHFYEKSPDGKTDYTKGKKPAVVVVLLQAQQLAIPPMTALQHVIPVNGLLSIKGDLAKTMIFASGKLRKDSWVEKTTGTIEDENMSVSITATRDDNGITLTRTFSVEKAKRMGLWVTQAQVNGQDGWKWKKSAWYKTPDRMLMYRALGNIARDLFSDVLLNMYTTEEAQDIQQDVTTIVETESGAKITIPDKEHANTRSKKMTDTVASKIPDNKFGAVKEEHIQEATIVPDEKKEEQGNTQPENKEEVPPVVNQNTEQPPLHEGQYTEAELEEMPTDKLKDMVMADMDMMEAAQVLPGKNTKKKLKDIILAHQEKKLAVLVAPYIDKDKQPENTGGTPGDDNQGSVDPASQQASAGNISPNLNFDNEGPAHGSKPPADDGSKKMGNKYGFDIPEQTPREFSVIKSLFNRLMGVTPQITTPRFLELVDKLGMGSKYADKELFLKNASEKEINDLLNAN